MTTELKLTVNADSQEDANEPIQRLEAIVRREDISEDRKMRKIIEFGIEVDNDQTSARVNFEFSNDRQQFKFGGRIDNNKNYTFTIGHTWRW